MIIIFQKRKKIIKKNLLKIMIQRIPKKIPQKKWIKRIKLIKKKFQIIKRSQKQMI